MVRKSTCKVDVDVEREEIRIARRARQYVTVRGRHRLYFEPREAVRRRVREREKERVINEWTRRVIPGGRAHTPPSLPSLERRCTMYDVRGGAGEKVEGERKINSMCVLRIVN